MAEPMRDRVLQAAATVFGEVGAVRGGRREIARQAGVPMRSVTAVGRARIDLLRQVLANLPASAVAQHISEQAQRPDEPALQALLQAVRDIFEDPAAGWDPVELQGLLTARFDDDIRAIEAARFERRWEAAEQVVHQLRGDGDDPVPDEVAALHLIAVGLGIAVLAPLSSRLQDPEAWSALTARMLDAIAADEVPGLSDASVTWRVRLSIPATATATARVMRALSLVDVRVASMFTAPDEAGRQLMDLVVRSPTSIDRRTIVSALGGIGTDVIVTRGVRDDMDDVATRVLHLSAGLAARPDQAPAAAAALVLADSWEVTDPASGADASALVLRLQWTFDRHVVLRRVRAPFTRTERNRASALLELVAALGDVRGQSHDFGWRETSRDGRDVVIRLARPQDSAGVEAMHARCSPESRYFRYFAPMSAWREDNLRRISGGHRGATLVATDDSDEVIALGNVFPAEPGVTEVAEIAIIVEDAWQRQGLGLLLLHRLVEVARRQGVVDLVAYVLSGNRSMIGLLEATGLTWTSTPAPQLGSSVLEMRTRV